MIDLYTYCEQVTKTMRQLLLLLTVFYVVVCQAAFAQTFNCGTIGAASPNGNRPFSPLRIRQSAFYLNTNNPAVCDGNVSRWTFCYYSGQSDDDDSSPRAQFAVYRFNQSGNGYDRVSRVFTAFGDTDSDNSFDCRILQLRSRSSVQVRAGDVLGVCVSSAQPLNIVGQGAQNFSLMEGSACNFNAVPNNVNPLITRDGLILHIYADAIFQAVDGPAPVTMLPPATLYPTMTLPNPMPTDVNPDNAGAETEAELGIEGGVNGTNVNQSPAASMNMGIVVAIIVVLVLVIVLAVVVVVFVILVVRHCNNKTDKDEHTENQAAFVALTSTSRTYDIPEISMSMKVEVQDEILKSAAQGSQEQVYDYANLKQLERSSYVSMRADPLAESHYSLLEPLATSHVSEYSQHLERNKQEDIYGSVGIYAKPASVETELYAQLRSFNIGSIPAEEITITGHLGSGYFGQVQQGVWIDGEEAIDVAMKTLNKQDVKRADKVKFLQEAAIMAQFRHPNIVTLYGISYKQEPMMLVLELVDRGNLKDYLLFLKPAPGEERMEGLPKLLLKFSQQVALGMQYLSARGYIHRDLAARNVLVNKHGICKITDFGMSRDLAEENYYVANNRDAVPVKWTAPEALYYKKYSTASDVWSYGCLLYEIWSLGHTPFGDVTNREVIRRISAGKRLPSPPGCPQAIYELMIRSWHPSSSDRPKFREMVLILISNEGEVLHVPQEALDTHRMAGELGAPLEAGEDMYPDLQMTYTNN